MKYTILFALIVAVTAACHTSAFTIFGGGNKNKNTNQDVELVIALKQKNIDKLESLVLDISNPKSKNYGKYLTQDQVRDFVSLPKSQVAKVYFWLNINGVHKVTNYGDALKITADHQTINKLLKTKTFKVPRSKRVVSVDQYTIPHYLQDTVQFIGGIYNKDYQKAKNKKKVNVKKSADVDSRYIGREVLCRLYNFDCNYAIKNNISVGAVEYQGNSGFTQTDVRDSQKNNGQHMKNISHIVGANFGISTESELDVQMISQSANNNQEWYWDVDGWLYEFAVDYFNAKESPNVTSHSWGWAEDKQCDIISCGNMTSKQYVQRVNNEYLKIVALGKTICVASGDAGAPGRTSEMCSVNRPPTNPVFPGSSPWVVSVGATYVVSSANKVNWTTPLCQKQGCATGLTEREINFEATGWTAGGGFSNYSFRPFWQNEAVNKYFDTGVPLPHNFSVYGRAYPDVTVTGHNCPTWEDGSVSGVDGTSCSSPTFAGLVGLLNDYQMSQGKPLVGLATPLFYLMYSSDPSTFNDIMSGNNWCTEANCCPVREDGGSNYGFVGSCGYDPVTGLGTPNIEQMKRWLDCNT
jgi:subtilase family serine protease